GLAAWLAAPGPMGSLDFASPNAIFVSSVLLTKPAHIFDDIQAMASATNPNAFAALSIFEQAFKVNLKDDLLSQLSGEITLEVDKASAPMPAWKAILRVNDANRLQQALSTLLAAAHMTGLQIEDGGVTYHMVRITSA